MVTENSKNAHCFHLEAFFPHSDESEHHQKVVVAAVLLQAQSETLTVVWSVCNLSSGKEPIETSTFYLF